MKTIISILSAAAIIMMSAACTKQAHTSLSEDSLPLKITVTGHVRYLVTDSDGKTEPEIVKKGTTVNIMYGIPDADGKIEFAHRTAETDINGFFESQIGCPTGKTMTVKVNSSEMGYSYTKDKEDSFVESEAFFFAELDKTVPGGKTVYFALDLTPSAYTSEDGMTQPAEGTGKP